MSKEIKSLTYREQCRDKVQVWFGSRSNHLHPVREALANSFDETYNNTDEGLIIVKLNSNSRTLSVTDNGRGIPLHLKTDGKYNYELLFETLFAGTKYENDDEFTTGTNGCGLTVTQYCSDVFRATSRINGKEYFVEYKDGNGITDKNIKGSTEFDGVNGTTIEFTLSEEVFDSTIFNPEEIDDLCYRVALVASNHTTVEFIDEVNNTHKKYKFKHIKEGLQNDSIEFSTLELLDENENRHKIQLVMTDKLIDKPIQDVYLNATYLVEGGTIHDGIYEAIRRYMHKYLQTNRLYKEKEKQISKDDVKNSIEFICNYFSGVVEFANQTKLSTKSKIYRQVVIDYVLQNLEVIQLENPTFIRQIANNILISKRSSEQTQDILKKTKAKLTKKINSIDNRVKGFVDCKKHGVESMLFISEGLSALGSIVLARDAEYQACFPLRGKVLNVLKAEQSTILKNKEIEGIIKVIGCGVETPKTPIDVNDSRFGYIVIATDQDSDGLHIQCLVLTVLYKLCPTLIKEGFVYILDTPLFEIRDKKTDKMYYAFSEKEMKDITSKLEKYVISRNKGLGEADVDVMSMCIKKGSKTIRQVSMEDAQKVSKWFDVFMGEDAETRKEYIAQNLHRYMDLD